MADETLYNLDDDREFFKFTIFGNTYNFRYLTADEMKKVRDIVNSDNPEKNDEYTQYLYTFIQPADEQSKPFSEIEGQMKGPHLRKFIHMIRVELGNAES